LANAAKFTVDLVPRFSLALPSAMDTFSRCLNRVFLVLCLFVGGGIVTTSFAGPESLPDYSKGKNPVIEETAPVCDPRWYISLGGGLDIDLGGTDLTHNFDRDFTSFFFIFPVASRAEMQSHDWNDVYDDAWRIQGEVGYALTQHLEVFGLFKYAHADATNRTSGDRLLLTLFGPTAVYNLRSDFGDYDAFGGELGFRFYFTPRASHIRPYVSVSGGATHVDSIDISTTANRVGSGAPDFLVYRGGFFNDSWVGAGTALLGVEFIVACHWAIGVNGGVHYETRLDQNDSNFKDFASFGATGVPLRAFRDANNDSGDRWTAPVTGYVKFRF
jgi:hypothetical protein